MGTIVAFAAGLVIGAFYPNYIKPMAIRVWNALKGFGNGA